MYLRGVSSLLNPTRPKTFSDDLFPDTIKVKGVLPSAMIFLHISCITMAAKPLPLCSGTVNKCKKLPIEDSNTHETILSSLYTAVYNKHCCSH